MIATRLLGNQPTLSASITKFNDYRGPVYTLMFNETLVESAGQIPTPPRVLPGEGSSFRAHTISGGSAPYQTPLGENQGVVDITV